MPLTPIRALGWDVLPYCVPEYTVEGRSIQQHIMIPVPPHTELKVQHNYCNMAWCRRQSLVVVGASDKFCDGSLRMDIYEGHDSAHAQHT